MATESVPGVPVTFDAFYTQLEDKKHPSIPSCLRAIHKLSSQEKSPIETLASLVRSGKNSRNKEHRDLARAIADLMVKSKFFIETERTVRDTFLEASSHTWHNLKTRIGEWTRMACNRILYGHTKSKEIQKTLTNVATNAIFVAIESAKTQEDIIQKFGEAFDQNAPKTRGTSLFKTAFLKEVEASKDEYHNLVEQTAPNTDEETTGIGFSHKKRYSKRNTSTGCPNSNS